MENDIRWVQRLSNYQNAFCQLEKGIALAAEKELSDLEKEGVIQRFENTQELAWKTIKNFYESMGETNIQGSSDAFKMAFEKGLIKNGQALMQTIKSRNNTVHTYNKKTSDEIYRDIVTLYYQAFKDLLDSLLQQKALRNL